MWSIVRRQFALKSSPPGRARPTSGFRDTGDEAQANTCGSLAGMWFLPHTAEHGCRDSGITIAAVGTSWKVTGADPAEAPLGPGAPGGPAARAAQG
jgi:hypothetical protein